MTSLPLVRENRILLLRARKDLKWKVTVIPMADFDPRKFPGYSYYRSFPHTSTGKEEAKTYAVEVEKEEEKVALHNKELAKLYSDASSLEEEL